MGSATKKTCSQAAAIGCAVFLTLARYAFAGDYNSDDLISITIRGETLSEVLSRLKRTSQYTFQVSLGDLSTGSGPYLDIDPSPPSEAFKQLAAAYGLCAIVDSAVVVGDQTLVKILSCERAEEYRKSLVARGRLEFSTVRLGMVTIDGEAQGCSGTGFRGAEVTEFYDTSLPAYQAGIRTGDVIVSFGGFPIGGSRMLLERAARVEPNTAIAVVIVRNCQQQTLTLQF